MKILNKAGLSTPINIVGMSVAFAAALILMVQVRRDAGYDKNFPSWENLYRMENNFIDDGLFSTYFSRPLIQIASSASPNIENIGTSWGFKGAYIIVRETKIPLLRYRPPRWTAPYFPFSPLNGRKALRRSLPLGVRPLFQHRFPSCFSAPKLP